MKKYDIGIILGSKSDWSLVEKALPVLDELGLSCVVRIASAHRTPAAVEEWVRDAVAAGVQVFIAVAGMAAALPGVVAARTMLPVIGVPVESGALRGQDALYSIAQMPPGVPVAAMGVGGIKNAFVLAARIIALKDPAIRKRVEIYSSRQAESVEKDQQELEERYPHLCFRTQTSASKKPDDVPALTEKTAAAMIKKPSLPGAASAKGSASKTTEPEAGFISTDAMEKALASMEIPQARRRKVFTLNPQTPQYDIIEMAADAILDGGVVALPTDTVYGLACDSTNPKAVNRLYSLKGREAGKPIPILIDGIRTLNNMVRKIPDDVMEMLEEMWPGALTVVFPKPEGMLSAVSPDASIGVRVPDCTITLSVISMVARPLAVTSANPSGMTPATDAATVEKYFGSQVDMILDGGNTPGDRVSTVISVLAKPYKILREGLISFETLRYHIKDLEK